jgi:hypothetical protein
LLSAAAAITVASVGASQHSIRRLHEAEQAARFGFKQGNLLNVTTVSVDN